jgi:hypothetical protein
MNSLYHAQSAAHKWGGTADDYIRIEEFIDSSKKIIGDVRHRSLYHHTEGVWLCQQIFGRTITVGLHVVPVRLIAERHVIEDLGWLPSPHDYINNMELAPWMGGTKQQTVPLSALGLKEKDHGRSSDFPAGTTDHR